MNTLMLSHGFGLLLLLGTKKKGEKSRANTIIELISRRRNVCMYLYECMRVPSQKHGMAFWQSVTIEPLQSNFTQSHHHHHHHHHHQE